MKKVASNKSNLSSELYSFEDKFSEFYSMPRFFHAGREKASKNFSYSEHHHVNYEWIYIIKGSVKYWINGVYLQANPGDFYFVQPGQTHKEECLDGPLEFYFLRFFYLDLKGQVNYLIPEPGKPELQLIRNVDKEFERTFKRVYKEAMDNNSGSKQVIEALILYLTWLLRRQLKLDKAILPDKVGYRVEVVNQAILYLKENINKSISLSELATLCCISQDYLSHIFKDITGISPIQYALRLKIDEAKSLLEKTDMSINAISSGLGFEDQLYFSRVFSKIVHSSPNKYRLNNNI